MKTMIAILGAFLTSASVIQGDWQNAAIASVTTAAILWWKPSWSRERRDG